MKLRPYQTQAIERLYANEANGVRRNLLCLPTGGGKTVCASRVIVDDLEAGQNVLFLAHRRELIKQPFCTLLRAGVPHQKLGVIMASLPKGGIPLPAPDPATSSNNALWHAYARRRPPVPIQIGSVDSLRTRSIPKNVHRIIVDESHRILAKSYQRVIEACGNPLVTGLSATPVRTDGKGLDEAFDDLIVVATYKQLVARGFLVAPTVYGARRPPDLSKVSVVAGDYNKEELGGVLLDGELMGDVVDHWRELGGGAPTLGFAVSVEHAERLAARFREAGISSAYVSGETPVDEREQLFEDLATGRVQVLWNCDVASEGTDIPAVKCVISARPTKSLRVWLQQAGRGSRPDGSGNRFVILDHAQNAEEHGLPQRDRVWTLEGRKKRKKAGPGAPLVWKCKACGTANDLKDYQCAECGAERPKAERNPLREIDGQLVELRELTTEDLADRWDWLVIEWRAWNNNPSNRPRRAGWLHHEFKKRYGVPSPDGCALPELGGAAAERRREWDDIERRYGHGAAAKRLVRDYPADDFIPPVTMSWG